MNERMIEQKLKDNIAAIETLGIRVLITYQCIRCGKIFDDVKETKYHLFCEAKS